MANHGSRCPFVVRPFVVLALVFTAVVSGAPVSTPAQTGGATIELQLWECPAGYGGADYLSDCSPGTDEAGDAYLYNLDLEDITDAYTDDDGFARLGPIAPGTYAIGAGVFRPYWTVYLTCFDTTTGAENFLFDATLTAETINADPPNNLIQIDAERDYACRYYITPGAGGGSGATGPGPVIPADPADASVGVQIFDCPEGYDGGEYADDCAPTRRPVGVTINDGYDFDGATVIADQAGDDGRAGFIALLRGQYFLAVEDLSATSTIYWSCFDLEGETERFDQDGYHNRIRFYLDTSADYSCRVYLTANGPELPEPGTAGTVTVRVFNCPESYDGPDWAVECRMPIDTYRVAITGYPSYDAEGPRGLEIYEGVAVFQDVPPGTYGPATDIPGHRTNQFSACVTGAGPIDDRLIDDESSNGTVTIAEEEGATCVVYIIPLSFRA